MPLIGMAIPQLCLQPRRWKSRGAGVRALHCNTVNSCFLSKHFPRLVGAGLALPSFHSPHKLQGPGKPGPYETCLVADEPPCAMSCWRLAGGG